jgi:serine/threonine-protein kinase
VAPFDPLALANSAALASSAADTDTYTDRRPSRPSRPAAAPQQARRRSLRGPLLLVLALLLVAAVGAGAWWFGWARWTSTPGVLGLKEQAAVQRIEAAGLGARIGDPSWSETVPEGEVVSTDPGPTARILKDGTVTVHLSKGPERYDVPKLRGLTEDEAQDRLSEFNLSFGSSAERWHETVPTGEVIRSVPKAGTTLKPGAQVDLVISKGREPIKVGDHTGKDFGRAKAALEKAGLVVKVAGEEYSDDVAEGNVISQSPTSGTLHRGEVVSFVVSKGPEMIEVPDVRASGESSARKELTDAGFEVEVERDRGYLGLGLVFRTDPSGGTMLARGSTVTIYLI